MRHTSVFARLGEPVNGYWGDPYFEELIFYTGILPLLAFLMLFRRPSALHWFYFAVGLIGIILALGSNTPMYSWLYEFFPPIKLLRGPGRAGILYVFASAGVLGEVISRGRPQEDQPGADRASQWMRFLTSLIIVLGLVSAVLLGSQLAGAQSADLVDMLQIQSIGVQRAILIAIIGLFLIWWLTASSKYSSLALVLLIMLTLFDLWSFGSKLVKAEPFGPHPMWADAQQIIGDESARVLPWGVHIFDQNGAGQVGMKSIFGYNTLEPAATIALAASLPDPRSQAYDALAIGYVLSPTAQEGYEEGDRPLRLVGNSENVWVYRRQTQLAEVRLLNHYEVVENADFTHQLIHAADFDPATTVILDSQPDCVVAEGEGSARIIDQDHGSWLIETESAVDALLVVSETYYPGWRVAIDGEPAEPLLAYSALRAVCVPAGEHTISWRYQPTIFLWGAALTILALVLLGVAVAKEKNEQK